MAAFSSLVASFATCVGAVAMLGPAQACEKTQRTAAPTHSENGIESHALSHAGQALNVRLWRFDATAWALRVVDMRDQGLRLAQNGSFGAPSFSLNELAQVLGNKSVVSSAGMTESLYSPRPVGLLKLAGKQKSGIYTSSRILDGLLCVDKAGRFKLLSEQTPDGRRVVQNKTVWDACYEAVQSGPMLVDDGTALILARQSLSGPRVFAGLDSAGRQVLGFVPSASTFDLACVLASSELGLSKALALQGDALGGIDFGMHSSLPADTWGQDHSGIASALVVTRRRR